MDHRPIRPDFTELDARVKKFDTFDRILSVGFVCCAVFALLLSIGMLSGVIWLILPPPARGGVARPMIIAIVGDQTGQINMNMEGVEPLMARQVLEKMIELIDQQYGNGQPTPRKSGLIVPAPPMPPPPPTPPVPGLGL